MNAIFKKDNVFVYVRDIDDDVKNDPSLILEENSRKLVQLGRVLLKDTNQSSFPFRLCRLWVDGITIYRGVYELAINPVRLDYNLPYETIVAYLNQMEVYGVDSFLENYKNALKEYRDELSNQEDKCNRRLATRDDLNETARLRRITDLLEHLETIIFNLSIHIAPGIEA